MAQHKDKSEIRYWVSAETRLRIKKLAESWSVKPNVAVELAVLKAGNSVRPKSIDDIQARLDNIETSLARILSELTGSEEV
ncbi:MAG: hypothetical protein WAX69_17120 [Victivallales bacterium]